MIRYLVLSNIAICLYYILYKILLQNDTFFSLKRFFLVIALIFSIIFPFIWWEEFCIETPNTFNNFSALFLNNNVNLPLETTEALPTQINWFAILYFGSVAVLFLQLLVRFISVLCIQKTAKKSSIDGQTVYITSQKITAFTFFSMIFIDEETAQNKETRSLILRHENVHKCQLHSIDTVFAEIISIFFFFNPFMWWLKKEIMLNLECIADNGVKQKITNLSAYQYAIINTTTHHKRLSFINQFNISNLQKRIIMLNKKTSKKRELIKYFSVLPIAVGLLLTSHLSVAKNAEVMDFINQQKKEVKKTVKVNSTSGITMSSGTLVQNENGTKETVMSVNFAKQDIDLGEIPQGIPATATYEFTNNGKTPIIITNVKTSCGCTTKEYTKAPVKAGQKGFVKATYNAKKLGKFSKTITVTLNNTDFGKIQLRIKGVVVAKKK